MLCRDYHWPEASKDINFRFGKAEDGKTGEKGGVYSALTHDLDANGKFAETKIGRSTLVDFKQVKTQPLGAHGNYMQGLF